MNQSIDALYTLKKDEDAYKLDYLIKNISSNKVYIKTRKIIKNVDYNSAHKQSLFYILKNLVALIDLDVIKSTSKVNIKIEDNRIINKLSNLNNDSFISEEAILILLNKINSLNFTHTTNIGRKIYKEKKPNLSLYIRAEKKGKEYKKYIRRGSTLIDFKEKVKNGENKELVFFDFEMNCLVDFKSVEIISIGAVKTDFYGNIKSSFYECVKPLGVKKLTEKCKEITKLNQYEIDNASSFTEVFYRFQDWIGEEKVIFCYWGGNDISVLKNDFKRNNFRPKVVKKILKNNIDIQEIYCKDVLKNESLLSLKNALGTLNTSFEGAEHNSLNDAFNLSKVYNKARLQHSNI